MPRARKQNIIPFVYFFSKISHVQKYTAHCHQNIHIDVQHEHYIVLHLCT